MGNLFGGAAPNPQTKVNKHDKAVLHLKIQRDKVQQYQKRIQSVMDRETEIARLLLKQGKRDRAKVAIARKKHQEKLLKKADTQLQNIQEMVETIEFTQCQQEVFNNLRAGADTLKELQKEMSVEAVEKLMEDTAEAIAWHDEVSQLIGQSLTPEDNSDIEAQIAAWEEEDLQAVLPTVPADKLPTADKVPTPVEQEEQLEDHQESTEEEPQLVPA